MEALEINKITIIGIDSRGLFRIIQLTPAQFELVKAVLTNRDGMRVSEEIKSLKQLK